MNFPLLKKGIVPEHLKKPAIAESSMIRKYLILFFVAPMLANIGCQPKPSPSAGRLQTPGTATLKKPEQTCLKNLKIRMIKGDLSFVEVSNPQLNVEVKKILSNALLSAPNIEYSLNHSGKDSLLTSMGITRSKKEQANIINSGFEISVPNTDAKNLFSLKLTYAEEAASGINSTLIQKFKVDANCHLTPTETDFTRTTLSNLKISAVHLEELAEEKPAAYYSSRTQTEVPPGAVFLDPEVLNIKLAKWSDLNTFLSSQEREVTYYTRSQNAPYVLRMKIDLGPDTEHFDPILGHRTQFRQLVLRSKRFDDSATLFSTNSEFKFTRFDNGDEKWIVNPALFESASF